MFRISDHLQKVQNKIWTPKYVFWTFSLSNSLKESLMLCEQISPNSQNWPVHGKKKIACLPLSEKYKSGVNLVL